MTTPTIADGTRGACRIDYQDDGKTVITVSQSWLGTYMNCPEQARRDLTDPAKYRSMGDSAGVGIAVHEALDQAGGWWTEEANLQGLTPRDFENELYNDAVEAMRVELDNVLSQPLTHHNLDWQIDGVFNRALAEASAEVWLEEGLRRLGALLEDREPEQVAFEQSGLELFLEGQRDDGSSWELWLHGTADVLLLDARVAHDWKTGKPYAKWECERNKAQHLVYALLFQLKTFYYEYLSTSSTKGHVRVDVRKRDIDRLQMICEGVAGTLLRQPPFEVPSWPVNPTGWWCSEKWCTSHALGECIGETRVVFPDFRKAT